jgi:glycerophosphoryl diester phosphodiesterase
LTVAELAWYRCDRNPDMERFPGQDPAPTALAGDDYRIVPLGDLFDFVDRYAASEDKTDAQRVAASTVAFNIETKRDQRHPEAIGDGFDGETVGPFEQRLLVVVAEYGLRDRVIIQSFDIRSLQAIDAADPDIRLSVLTAVPHAALPAFATGRTVVWSPKSSTVDATSVEAAHAAGHTVVPWTVDDLDEATRLIELGVDGLITDRPDLFTDR